MVFLVNSAFFSQFLWIYMDLFVRVREKKRAQHCPTLPKYSKRADTQRFVFCPNSAFFAQRLPTVAQILPKYIRFAQIIINCPKIYRLLGRLSKDKVLENQSLISFWRFWATLGVGFGVTRIREKVPFLWRLPVVRLVLCLSTVVFASCGMVIPCQSGSVIGRSSKCQ